MGETRGHVFVVEDETLKRETLLLQLREAGFEAEAFANPYPALERLREVPADVVISDIRMPSMDGIRFLHEIRAAHPGVEVILMTAHASVDTAVAALRAGVADYLIKPFTFEELEVRLERILAARAVRQELHRIKSLFSDEHRCHGMLGHSKAIREVFGMVRMLAENPCTVLIVGESGTGKEMVAEALHALGSRRQAPVVKVSCAVLNPQLLESELFGHEPGAFTGALRRHRGRFELANGGTILLDDIDDMPLDTQVKLVRVLQDRRVERVGGESAFPVDIRIVAATKKDLSQLVADGHFREDLYYRLNVAVIPLPPLRARREDIPMLAAWFVERHGAHRSAAPLRLAPETVDRLMAYAWPGNVRELEHAMERAVAFCTGDEILPVHLPETLSASAKHGGLVSLHIGTRATVSLVEALNEVERRLLDWALERAQGNQATAAALLEVPRTTFRDRLARFAKGEDGDAKGTARGTE